MNAQIVINEFMASNPSGSDWIEIKNTGASTVDISGYYLSDDISNPTKWSFPIGTTIGANNYTLVFADGSNSGLSSNFKLSASGEDIILSHSNLSIIDSYSFGLQYPGVSHGRKSDNSWAFFNNPTMWLENDDASSFYSYAQLPTIDVPSGLYNSSQFVSISAEVGSVIYYTNDGSVPTSSSIEYTGPITINSTTVLKAIVVKNGSTSLIESRSYIFGASHTLPVILITPDKEERAASNNKRTIDGRIRFEFFESDGTQKLGQYAAFKLSGQTSASYPQFNGKVRAKYGNSSFDYKFFPNKEIDSFKGFLLRNSSQDFALSHMRDAVISKIYGDDDLMNGFAFEGYRAAVLYVNGVYSGVIHVREDDDNLFVENNYPNQNATAEPNDIFYSLEALNYNNASDRQTQEETLNLQDYLNAQTVIAWSQASEWPYPTFVDFDSRIPKYSMYMHDHDYSMGNYGGVTVDYPFVESSAPDLSSNIMNYTPYKNEALQYISALYNNVFDSIRVNQIINEIRLSYLGEMDAYAAYTQSEYQIMYGATTYNTALQPRYTNEASWSKHVDSLIMFVNKANDGIFDKLQTKFSASNGQFNLTCQTSGSNHGNVYVHDIKVLGESKSGTYFKGIPIRLEAKAKPGYVFSHWEGSVSGSVKSLTHVFWINSSVKAVFVPITYTAYNVHINEVQPSNNSTIVDEAGEFDDWIEIYNDENFPVNIAGYYISDSPSNPRKWEIKGDDPSKTTIAAKGFLLLWADKDTLQGSNHVNFKLNKTDEVYLTYENALTTADSIAFSTGTDSSFGSQVDGANTYVKFESPTPGASNNLITKHEEVQYTNVKVYPVPATDKILIESGIEEGISSIQIFGIDGKLWLSKEQINRRDYINISLLPKGIYTVAVSTEGSNVKYGKIVKK